MENIIKHSSIILFLILTINLFGCSTKSNTNNTTQTPVCSVRPQDGYCYSHGKPEISSLIKFCFKDMKKFNNCVQNEFKKKSISKDKQVEIKYQ